MCSSHSYGHGWMMDGCMWWMHWFYIPILTFECEGRDVLKCNQCPCPDLHLAPVRALLPRHKLFFYTRITRSGLSHTTRTLPKPLSISQYPARYSMHYWCWCLSSHVNMSYSIQQHWNNARHFESTQKVAGLLHDAWKCNPCGECYFPYQKVVASLSLSLCYLYKGFPPCSISLLQYAY